MVVPNISLKALISALINVKSDFISVESVGIIVFPDAEGDGEDFVKIVGVGLASGSLSSLVRIKEVRPKFMRQRKKIIIKTLAYLSIIICYYKYSIILVAKYMKNPFIISGLFFLFSIIFLFVFFNKSSRDSLVEQVQHRQQLAVRAGSKSIESLINSIGKSLLMMSDNPNQDRLDHFVEAYSSLGISGIALLDKNGIVIGSSNIIDTSNLGQDLSDRVYFKWAKETNDNEFKAFAPIISRRGPTKDGYIIPVVASTLLADKKFNGVLVTAVSLSNLSRDYLNDLKILETSKAYLVTSDGEIIYADYPELTGKNIKDIFANNFLGKDKILEIFIDNLKKDEESKFNLAIPNLQNNSKLESYLISASPIHIYGQLWKVVVVTPEKSLLAFTYSILNSQILVVFVIFVVFILLTLRISKNSGYQEAVTDEHKIHNIKS